MKDNMNLMSANKDLIASGDAMTKKIDEGQEQLKIEKEKNKELNKKIEQLETKN